MKSMRGNPFFFGGVPLTLLTLTTLITLITLTTLITLITLGKFWHVLVILDVKSFV